jgi:ribosomal protein L18
MKKVKNKIKEVRRRYLRRKHRINTILKKVTDLPRLIVFKSNKYTYAQIVDRN